MVNTHCLPSGSLGSGELPVPNVAATLMSVAAPAPGSRRGVVVLIQGFQFSIGSSVPSVVDVGGIQPINLLSLRTALVSDGWVVVCPQIAQNLYVGLPQVGLGNDVSADAAHGARFVAQVLHWWDHIVDWIKDTYGNWPIVPLGFSWGGWHVFQIAANRSVDITAYVSHHAATVLSALSPVISTPVDFTAINTTGLDTTSTMLNAVTKPGLIGWGTADPVVGDSAIQAIYNAANGAGRPVTSNGTATGHTLNNTDITTITGWFTSTVDPLAPANL